MSHTVEFGEHVYRPTADNPFPFTTSQLARLEVQASRVGTLRLAYRRGQEAFRHLYLLPTSEPGLDRGAVTNQPPLSDVAAGMLGRLDRANPLPEWACYGCRMEGQHGIPVKAWLHSPNCSRRNANA